MALTPSTMLALNTKVPGFSLPDVLSGKMIKLDDFEEKSALLVMFICRHCPYVQHIKEELSRLGKDYEKQDIGIIAISSNDSSNYPDDSPASLKAFAKEIGLNYPLCFDEDQSVAKAYTAACTPDFFLFARSRDEVTAPLQLVYRGQLDDSRPGNGKPVTGNDLRAAMDAVLTGMTPDAHQRPSMGCNIKWKLGNQPEYFKH